MHFSWLVPNIRSVTFPYFELSKSRNNDNDHDTAAGDAHVK